MNTDRSGARQATRAAATTALAADQRGVRSDPCESVRIRRIRGEALALTSPELPERAGHRGQPTGLELRAEGADVALILEEAAQRLGDQVVVQVIRVEGDEGARPVERLRHAR